MHVFERALPLALTVFCGVVGGIYTFQPIFAPDAQKKIDPSKRYKTLSLLWVYSNISPALRRRRNLLM
ncbi:hypothetical protein EDB82DRAFT_501423, partial [Fusarium venenatum]|uniref:uncharacterized protein n=1 Tax=Fusarium venenatum TaxID=56646 RepID=UPI001DE57F68